MQCVDLEKIMGTFNRHSTECDPLWPDSAYRGPIITYPVKTLIAAGIYSIVHFDVRDRIFNSEFCCRQDQCDFVLRIRCIVGVVT